MESRVGTDQSAARLPVLAICGYSGSGKTALIERLVRALRRRGLRVAVIKHAAHGIEPDLPGKDSSRLFQAGADVVAVAPGERLVRTHARRAASWREAARDLAGRHDLVILEGFKSARVPVKVWLRRTAGDTPPPDVGELALDLPPGASRVSLVLKLLRHETI